MTIVDTKEDKPLIKKEKTQTRDAREDQIKVIICFLSKCRPYHFMNNQSSCEKWFLKKKKFVKVEMFNHV